MNEFCRKRANADIYTVLSICEIYFLIVKNVLELIYRERVYKEYY